MTKKELKRMFENQIKEIDSSNERKKVYDILESLCSSLDSYDGMIKNLIDNITIFVKRNDMSKMISMINDIVDNFDKYEQTDKDKIYKALKEIKEICDRNFMEKLLSVLSFG